MLGDDANVEGDVVDAKASDTWGKVANARMGIW